MDDFSSAPEAARVEQLLGMLAERDRVIAQLSARVAELEARLGKNSQNSSQPPSSDAFVKPPPRSLRRRSGRRPGKQPGERGSWLEPRAEPDEVVVHAPSRCRGCGGDLAGTTVVGEARRQVFDLPPVALRAVEHRLQRRVCGCGQVTAARVPAGVSAPACYGPRVAALGCYLLARQHLPVARAAEALSDCFGTPVSTGWLAGLLPEAASRLEGFLAATREQLTTAPVVHFDETGAWAARRRRWIHVAATDTLTLFHLDERRGVSAIDAAGVMPNMSGVAVHDGHTPYRRYDLVHGLCNAHHLRELAGIAEATGQNWANELADLLVEIHIDVQTHKQASKKALSRRLLARYRRRYADLLDQGQRLNPKPAPTGKAGRPRLGPAGSLLRRLDLYRDDVLRFASDFTVPFDNNQAERDIRMVKLQQKISGSWRSDHGARAFLTVRSYLSTARKHHQAGLQVLSDLFNGRTWIPAIGPAP